MPTRKHSPELRLLHGTGGTTAPEATPVVHSEREPEPPGDLTPVERRLWDEVTAELRELDLLHAADGHEVQAYVRLVALGQRVHAELTSVAVLTSVNLETGVLRPHPLLATLTATLRAAHLLANGLGLNPHGRSLIHGRTAPRPDTEAAHARDLYA
jgi:phage terminase small subunit